MCAPKIGDLLILYETMKNPKMSWHVPNKNADSLITVSLVNIAYIYTDINCFALCSRASKTQVQYNNCSIINDVITTVRLCSMLQADGLELFLS